MDYLNFLTKVVGKNLIYNPSIVRFLLIDIWADPRYSTSWHITVQILEILGMLL